MSVTISQTGIPALVQIVPGPGVAFTGQGAPGVGIAGAAIDGNGHLQILRTDAVTMDVGKVAPAVANVAAGGSQGQLDGTPLAADVNLLTAGVQGGSVVLVSGPNRSVTVVNKLAWDVPVYPPAINGSGIDALSTTALPQQGGALTVAAGTTQRFHTQPAWPGHRSDGHASSARHDDPLRAGGAGVGTAGLTERPG